MSARPGWRIEDVLARTDLADLLDQLAEPAMFVTRGRRWHCPLPEHDDHHASVTIHTDHRGHQRWRCWSGDNDHRGDAIDLVRVTQHLGRTDAVDWLANRAGLVAEQPVASVQPRPPVARADVPLDPGVTRYVEACERILWGPTGRPVRDWLHARGFSDELLRANRVGCDPGRAKMHRQRGLPYGGSTGAVFPALNEAGDVHYVQTRYLNPGEGPKYDNPAASLGANPRLGWTRTPHVERVGTLVVCEGIPDALTAAADGFVAVAILGSQAPDNSVADRISASVSQSGWSMLVVNDHDDAGRGWAAHVGRLFEQRGVTVSHFEPPLPGSDLNSWRAESSSAGMLLAESYPLGEPHAL